MSEYGIVGLTEKEVNDFMEAINDSGSTLPEGTIARIDVIEDGESVKVMVNLRSGMPGEEFAAMLHTIAAGFEDGTAQRLEVKS